MSEVRIQGRTVAGLAVALVSATFALSGCSSHQGAVAAATASEVPVVATPSPLPTATAIDQGLDLDDENTAGSARAAVVRYVAVVNAAYMSGDVTQVLALSAPGCRVCNLYIKSIREVYRQRAHVVKATRTIVKLGQAETVSALVRMVPVRYRTDGFVVVDDEGQQQIVEAPAIDQTSSYALKLEASVWRIQSITALKL